MVFKRHLYSLEIDFCWFQWASIEKISQNRLNSTLLFVIFDANLIFSVDGSDWTLSQIWLSSALKLSIILASYTTQHWYRLNNAVKPKLRVHLKWMIKSLICRLRSNEYVYIPNESCMICTIVGLVKKLSIFPSTVFAMDSKKRRIRIIRKTSWFDMEMVNLIVFFPEFTFKAIYDQFSCLVISACEGLRLMTITWRHFYFIQKRLTNNYNVLQFI